MTDGRKIIKKEFKIVVKPLQKKNKIITLNIHPTNAKIARIKIQLSPCFFPA